MGRPAYLCALCPDSRKNAQPTIQSCERCPSRLCRKHIVWYENGWVCARCVRNDKKLKEKRAKS